MSDIFRVIQKSLQTISNLNK